MELKIGGNSRHRPDGTLPPQIALPVFGYKSHISIDQRYGFISGAAVTSASEADGRMLRHLVAKENTASEIWADNAHRSKKNERWPMNVG